MTITGLVAEVWWGYHKAASLGSWSFSRTRGQAGGALTATVIDSDAFKLTQSPLTVVIPAKPQAWRWALSEVEVSGSTLTATVTVSLS
jgi:hypothetical protein